TKIYLYSFAQHLASENAVPSRWKETIAACLEGFAKSAANDRRAASPVNHRSANRADLIWRGCGISRHQRPSDCAGSFLFRHILASQTSKREKRPIGDSMAHDASISHSTKN